MNSVFLKLLNLSITAGWLILAVVVLRLIFKKAPKWISCVLWALVAIRLICPFSFESVLSLIPSAETIPANIEFAQQPAIDSGISIINKAVNPVIVGSFTSDAAESTNPLQIIISILTTVWITGVFVLLAYALFSYIRLKKKVSASILLHDNIYTCDEVKSPFILGIFRPMIYVPSSMDNQELNYVITHETAHIKRRDHWWKPFGYLLLTLYWFNPLIWLAYILLCRDIELACDEKVVRNMNKDNKAAYSQAMLNCNFPRRMVVACPIAFGEVGVKERVESVLNYKKPAFWIIVVAVIVCIVVAVCFLTNPFGVPLNKFNTEMDSTALLNDISELSVKYQGKINTYSDEATINHFISTLSRIRISSIPVSQDRSENREKAFCIIVHGDTELCFNEDFTEYWIDNNVKPTLSYRIRTPEIARELILDYNLSTASANDIKYFLTIAEDGVYEIKVSTSSVSGGCRNADSSPYKKGEEVWLEPLDGFEKYDGLQVTALDKNGKAIVSFSVPQGEVDSPYTYHTAFAFGEWLLHSNRVNASTTDENDNNVEKAVSWDLIPMVMASDGILYLDTGYKSSLTERPGTMMWQITSEIDRRQKPTEKNQSNFDDAYCYQYGEDGTIEVNIDGIWWIYATEEKRRELQLSVSDGFTQSFTDIMGLQGYYQEKVEGVFHTRTYYVSSTNGSTMPMAESFGFEINDYVLDLDGDGVTELICNCQYGGDGHESVYIYRVRNGAVERGQLDIESLNLDDFDNWGVNATREFYDAEANEFILEYYSKKDEQTMNRVTLDYDSFTFS